MYPGIDAQAGNVPGGPPTRLFDVVLRGYDRHQTDQHIEQLEDQARQYRGQAQALERERPADAGLRPGIKQLLRLAGEQATEILGEARAAADELQAVAKAAAA